MAYFRP